MKDEAYHIYLSGLVSELRKLPQETGWLEFKENVANPEDIGEYISALSNTAALKGKANAYVVWGVHDGRHEVMGTTFMPFKAKKGNEDLESWLLHGLTPRPHFHFHELLYEGKPIVVLEIPRASGRPVQFLGAEYIRVGSYRKKLKDFPQIEKELWRVFDVTPFEDLLAGERLMSDDVLSLIDYPSYFNLLEVALPTDREKILARLGEDRMIVADEAGRWGITNLGAVLFARNLTSFKTLSRKVVRVIVYEGKSRLRTLREQAMPKGYAAGFAGLLEMVNVLSPRREFIGQALRQDLAMFPELAVRELIANALIHQDFSMAGAGPMIEIFADRMEVTNPGLPLMRVERFLDTPPRSRNEALASLMRRIGMCEERGSGVDKVVFETEQHQLPPPIFETVEGATRVVLFAHKALREMERNERSLACYLHACLRYVERDPMTNSSLRGRFGVAEKNSAMVSRIIKDAMEDNMVKAYDPDQSKKFAKYLPFWA